MKTACELEPRRAAILLLAGLIGAACCAGCGKGDEATAPTPVASVQVAAVEQGPLQHWVRDEAVLYPLRQAIITPKISAPVSKFFVDRGSRVRAGEPLAELENRDLIAAENETASQYQAAEANYQALTTGAIPEDLKRAQLDEAGAQQSYDAAEQVYTSRQELFRQGALPRRDMEQAGVDATQAHNALTLAQQRRAALEATGHAAALQAAEGDLKAAQARAAAAAAEVGYSKIASPISGVVTDRPVYPGELATTSTPLMTIMDVSQVVGRAHLPASEAARLKVGDRATLTPLGSGTPLGGGTSLGGGTGTGIEGRVTVVSPATDPGSTTVEVWVQAANPDEALRPGTSVAVAILSETIPQALIIPSSALLTEPTGETSVMLAGADGKAHQQAVEVGVKETDQAQILKGLAAGQNVISVGAFGLPDNTQIKIVAAPAAGDKDGGQ